MTSYALRSTLFVDTNSIPNPLENPVEDPSEDESDGYLVLTFNNGSSSVLNNEKKTDQQGKSSGPATTRLTSRFASTVGIEGASSEVSANASRSLTHSPSSTSSTLLSSVSGSSLLGKTEINNEPSSSQSAATTSKRNNALIIESPVRQQTCSSTKTSPSSSQNGKIHRVVQIKNGHYYIQPVGAPSTSTTSSGEGSVQQRCENESQSGAVPSSVGCSPLSVSNLERSCFCPMDTTVGSSGSSLSGGTSCTRMLKCNACGKYYRNHYSLRHHICLKRKDVWKKGDIPSQLVNGQLIYYCPTCFKPFKWLGNLTRHFYVHTGQRFFKCDVCDKEFFSAYQVRRHMNSHTGLRFRCEVCAKPFTCKYACAWHTRQHYNAYV